jgi:large subunit ribosomal protein LX
MKFEVKGFFKQKGLKQKFTKEIEANNAKLAEQYVFSLLGSEHKIPRRQITITEINELKEVKKDAKRN